MAQVVLDAGEMWSSQPARCQVGIEMRAADKIFGKMLRILSGVNMSL